MAHECPECGQVCYCGGDIDDLCLNDDASVNRCSHCDTANDREDDDDSESAEGGVNIFDTEAVRVVPSVGTGREPIHAVSSGAEARPGNLEKSKSATASYPSNGWTCELECTEHARTTREACQYCAGGQNTPPRAQDAANGARTGLTGLAGMK